MSVPDVGDEAPDFTRESLGIAHRVVISIGEGRDTEEYLAALQNCPV